MTKLKCGLIQMALKCDTDMAPDAIRNAMLEAHVPLIDQAGEAGVQVLCFQEVFTQPYFCPSQDAKWYAAAEAIPDGHTTRLMQDYAKQHNMVIVVPIYEEEMTGVYFNTAAVIDADGSYLGKYRKSYIPHVGGFWEKFFFKPGNSDWPVFETAYCKLGVYICYDRHFPEGWRALALGGAEYIVNPVGDRRRPFAVSVGARTARVGGGQRRVHRRDQPRRHRGAVEHRRVLRAELRRQPARRDRRPGERRLRRAADPRNRPRYGPRNPQQSAILPRSAARALRSADRALVDTIH